MPRWEDIRSSRLEVHPAAHREVTLPEVREATRGDRDRPVDMGGSPEDHPGDQAPEDRRRDRRRALDRGVRADRRRDHRRDQEALAHPQEVVDLDQEIGRGHFPPTRG